MTPKALEGDDRSGSAAIIIVVGSPEAGDAPVGIMSERRKYPVASCTEAARNAFLSRRDKKLVPRYASAMPSNSINTAKNYTRKFAGFQNNSFKKLSNVEVDYRRFPYYRSNRADGSQDAVLVKDAGTSCHLLHENAIEPDVPISETESYLVRQLKLEYHDLSNIIKKLNTHAKDILNSLVLKCRKDEIFDSLRAIANREIASLSTHEIEDSLFKLRLHDGADEIRGSSDANLNNSCSRKKSVTGKMHKNTDTIMRSAELDGVFVKEFLELSPKRGVLLRNYLITKREKVSGNASKARLRKIENFSPPDENRADKSCDCVYTCKRDSSVFTNWQKVSRREETKKLRSPLIF
ncbi:uncharacterized protein [Cardiocondyla obscurior]|uniref:uncharacterized protein n=1 Tax=Cardiocondyla obscurior TaxID=286306 RepID=UPI0039656F2B